MGIKALNHTRKKEKYVPGSRWQKRLPRSLLYDLESLEPRYMLDATLYDNAASGADSATKGVIQTQLGNLFDQLTAMGTAVNTNTEFTQTVVPFFGKSLSDLMGNFKIGDILTGNGTQTYKGVMNSFYGGDSTPLASELATALSGMSGVTVTQTSTEDDFMKLSFTVNLNSGLTDVALNLGDAAQEFSLVLGPGATVKVNKNYTATFEINVDLGNGTTMFNSGTSANGLSGAANNSKFSVDFSGNDLTFKATSLHNASNYLSGFGVGFGIMGARTTVGDAGGYVPASPTGGTFTFDTTSIVDITDSTYNLGDSISALTVSHPTTSSQNQATLTLPVAVSNPTTGTSYISGLEGVSGSFTISDSDLFDNRIPLTTASNATLSAFSRLNAADLLSMAESTSFFTGQAAYLEQMQTSIPFLDLALGEAYGWGEATDLAFVDPLRIVENVLTSKNAPSTSNNPLDFTGAAAFTLVTLTGTTSNTYNISLSSSAGRTTTAQLITDLNQALTTAGTVVRARLTTTASPRIELYSVKATTFVIGNISGALDIGFEPYGYVYRGNSGTISGTGNAQYQLPTVNFAGTALTLGNFTTPKTFTLKVNGGSATTVTLQPGLYRTIYQLADELRNSLISAGLTNAANTTGVIVAVTDGKLVFTESHGYTVQFGGSDYALFNVGTTAAATVTSSSAVSLTPFHLTTTTFTLAKNGGATTTVNLAAAPYGSAEEVAQGLRNALQDAGLYDSTTNSGILVRATTAGGIELYGSEAVYQIVLGGTSGNLSRLGLTAGTSTAASIQITVNKVTSVGPVVTTPTVTTVYITGNTTNGMLGGDANTTPGDLATDIRNALIRAGVLNDTAGTGVDIRAVSDGNGAQTESLEFFVRNSGSDIGDIRSFALASIGTGLSNLNFTAGSSTPLAISSQKTTAKFNNLQEMVSLLRLARSGTAGVLTSIVTAGAGYSFQFKGDPDTTSLSLGGTDIARFGTLSSSGTTTTFTTAVTLSNFNIDATDFTITRNGTVYNISVPKAVYATIEDLATALRDALKTAGLDPDGLLNSTPSYNSSTQSFDIPVKFSVDKNFGGTGLGLDDITGVGLVFDSQVGTITDLTSATTQTVSRKADIEFKFGINMVAPLVSTESLTMTLPVPLPDWDGKLDYDVVLDVMLDDGNTTRLQVTVADMADNTSTADFVADLTAKILTAGLNTKLSVVKVDIPDIEREGIKFTTTAGTTRSFTIFVPEKATAVSPVNNSAVGQLGFTTTTTTPGYTATGTTPIIANNAVVTSGNNGRLTTNTYFNFVLPDGSKGAIELEAADTALNNSLADLVERINESILATGDFSINGYQGKIVASLGTGTNANKIIFNLNPDLFPAGGAWSLQINATYNEFKSNGAFYDLAFQPVTTVEANIPAMGFTSQVFSGTNPYRLTNDMKFDVSINGSNYTSVVLDDANTSTNNTIGDLISDINTRLAATNVTIGSTSYALSTFLKAEAISGGQRIQIRVLDNSVPAVQTVRFAPNGVTNNSYISQFGYSDKEVRFAAKGSDPYMTNVKLGGTATVSNGNVVGTGNFGYAQFNVGSGDVDITASSQLEVAGVSRLADLLKGVSGETVGWTLTHTVRGDTQASVRLGTLSFPVDAVTSTGLTGLAFGSGAYIDIKHELTSGSDSSRITDFDTLAAPKMTYNNTNGMHLLNRLSFDDVIASLWRVGDMLSDYMWNDPNGPFLQDLLFVKSGLVEQFDFGQKFNMQVDQLEANPPTNLQEFRRALASGLQLDLSAVNMSIVTTGSGNTLDVALNISFELIKAISVTLPLYVDLATLRGRSTNPALVQQYLLELSAITSNPTDPLTVDLNALGKLKLNLDIQAVDNGAAIESKGILKNPSSGDLFEMKFNLAADGLNADLPAGANRLRLGSTAPSVDVATTAALGGTYSNGIVTASAVGDMVIDGITIGALGQKVLVKNQSNAAQNGIYTVTTVGNATTAWVLTRDTLYDSGDELKTAKVQINSGTDNGKKFFRQTTTSTITVGSTDILWATYDAAAADQGLVAINATGEVALADANGTPQIYDDEEVTVGTPTAANTTVVVSTIGNIALSGSGSLTIDGVTLAANNLVLVNHQTDSSKNGVYKFSGGSTWTLTRDTAYDTAAEFANKKIRVSGGTYAGKDFIQTQTVTTLGTSAIRFAKLIDPASYRLNLSTFNSTTNKVLAYQVAVATTSGINTNTADSNRTADYDDDDSDGITKIIGHANGSINSLATKIFSENANAWVDTVGIDGFRGIQAGDYILVKDQFKDLASVGTYQGNYQNGVYEVVSVGGTNSKWELHRVDFADTYTEFQELRISALKGLTQGDTRWIQNNNNLTAISSGNNIKFNNEVYQTYGNYDTATGTWKSWLTFAATGQAQTHLPLSIVLIGDSGSETLITKDLSTMTVAEKERLGRLGSAIVSDAAYQARPDLPALKIQVASLENYFNFPSSTAVTVSSLPNLRDSMPPSNILTLLKDPFLMGDALDLALFTLQFALDQALGIQLPMLGPNLPHYVSFIEDFRDNLTTRIREELRLNPLMPINAIRRALFATLGPAGIGFLADGPDADSIIDIDDVQIYVKNNTTDTNWDIDAATNYGLTPQNQKFEIVSAAATTIAFGFKLAKAMDTDATAVNINSIDLGDSTLGMTISNITTGQNAAGAAVTTEGGVNLKRSFEMNFGFGMDLFDGFYVFNPTQASASSTPTSPMIKVGIEAALDGDIHTAGVQQFEQADFNSHWNNLTVRIRDSRLDYAQETVKRASGFYGDFIFNLNTGTETDRARGVDGLGATVNNLRLNNALGKATELNSLLRFDVNADSDVHLMVESRQETLIPSVQVDFMYGQRYGTGSTTLIFANDIVAGLGDATLGQKVRTYISSSSGATDAELQKASPIWRINRSVMTADGKAGTSFVDYQNISIDVESFLGGPVYRALQFWGETTAPLKPYVDFMMTPIPGTEWMATPLTLSLLLGTRFQAFASGYAAIDALIGPILGIVLGGNDKPSWMKARADLAGTAGGTFNYIGNQLTDSTNKKLRDLYKEARKDKADEIERKQKQKEDDDAFKVPQEDTPKTTKQKISALSDALEQKLTTPNKFSQAFDKFRDGDTFNYAKDKNGKPASFKDTLKKSVQDALNQTDDRGGRKQAIVGFSGGGVKLDALTQGTILDILLGREATLLRVEIPRFTGGFAFSKSFPLPAFPPLQLTLNLSITLQLNFNFGWDTRGFFWSVNDSTGASAATGKPAPLFSFQGRFAIGVALNFGLIEAGIQAFFEAGIEFLWNDISHTGKLRDSEIQWLKDHGGSIFDIRVYGRIGLTLYVDLTIPIPIVGPISVRLIEKTFVFTLFDHTFYGMKGFMELGSVDANGVLLLNMGRYASDRLFINTDDRNEVFKIYGLDSSDSTNGDDIVVEFAGNYAIFNNVKRVIGYAGRGQSVIDAGADRAVIQLSGLNYVNDDSSTVYNNVNLNPLKYAVVDFFGGDGNSILSAGASYNTAWGRSRLQGGSGTNTLNAGTKGLDLISGLGNTIINGSPEADTIVSGLGSDLLNGKGGGDSFYFNGQFGRDRLLVQGTGNSVSFAGTTINGYTSDSKRTVAAYSVGAQTTAMKLQFGQLVQSAKMGSNTIFYAVDPSGTDSVDSWTAGSGDDIINIFHFTPNKTLNIYGGLGKNFYTTYLGNPGLRYYSDISGVMDTRNYGTVNINDAAGTGRLLLIQGFAEAISYDSTQVSNGREKMGLTGISRIDLDSGDSVVYWGNVLDPLKYTFIPAGTVTTGRLILLGNVEVNGDLTLNLNRTLELNYSINIAGATNTAFRKFTLNITNPNPDGFSDLILGRDTSAPTTFKPGIYLSQGTVLNTTTTPAGDGYGSITINLPTGGITNASSTRTGLLKATNGNIELKVRDTIGLPSQPIEVASARISAETTSTLNPSGDRGIYLYSAQDLNALSSLNVNGLVTANGVIFVEVAPGAKFTYNNIVAGGAKNITIIADNIDVAGNFTVDQRYTYTSYELQVTVNYQVINYWVPFTYFYGFFNTVLWFPFQTYIPIVTYNWVPVVYTTVQTTSYSSSNAKIQGTGDMRFLNATNDYTIEAGGDTPTAGTLSLTKKVLDTLQTGFASIVIGRDSSETIKTGTVKVKNYNYDDKLYVRSKNIQVGGAPGGTDPGEVSSAVMLQFDTYGTGAISFDATGHYEAPTISVRSANGFTAQGTFTSTATSSGLIQLIAGFNTGAGGVTVSSNATLTAAFAGSDIQIESGSTSGDITINSANVSAADLLSLTAAGGSLNFSTIAGTDWLTANRLSVVAKNATVLRTKVNEITSARTTASGQSMTITEYDDVNLVFGQTNGGAFSLTTQNGGDITIDKITTGGSGNITLSAQGEIFGNTPATGDWNIIGSLLSATAKGDIELITQVSQLSLTANNLVATRGSITINNTGTLTAVTASTTNGAVTINNDHGITIDSISTSNTNNAANTVSINNRFLASGGSIIVDKIDAGSLGDVTLISDGLISVKSSGTVKLVTAHNLTAESHGAAATSSLNAIDLIIRANLVNAETFAAGRINILSDRSLTLRDLESYDGNIIVNITNFSSLLTVAKVNANAANVSLIAAGNISDIDAGVDTNIDPQFELTDKISGNTLTVTSVGTTTLDTSVSFLDVQVAGAGVLTIKEGDGVTVTRATTNSGNIFLTAGDFKTDGVTIHAGGNITTELIRAGGGADNITLKSIDGFVKDNSLSSLVQGNLLTLDTWQGVQLTTRINTLVAVSRSLTAVLGSVIINEFDGITLDTVTTTNGSIDVDAGGTITNNVLTAIGSGTHIDIDTTTGDIVQTTGKITTLDLRLEAPGDITALTNVGTLTANITGGTGTKALTITEDNGLDIISATSTYANMFFTVNNGDLNIRTIDAGVAKLRNVTITVTNGSITKGATTAPASNIRGNLLTITARNGVDLVTDINTLILNTTSSASTGNVVINNRSGITLQSVQTANGSITIDSDGSMTASSVTSNIGSAVTDIILRTHSASQIADLIYGVISAGGGASNVSLTIDGIINWANAATSLISANLLTFATYGTAAVAANLRTRATSQTGRAWANGNIYINETGQTLLNSIITTLGDIEVDAALSLSVNTLTATGTGKKVDLDVASGSIFQSAGKITADDLYIDATDNVSVLTNVKRLVSATIVGGTPVKNLNLTEDNDLDLVLAQSTYADMTFFVGGNLNVRTIDAGAAKARNVTLNVSGNITKTAPTTPAYNVRANKLTINAAGSVDLVTDLNKLGLVTTAVGNVILNNLSNLVIDNASVVNGAFTLVNNGTLDVTSFSSLTSIPANTVTITTTSASNTANATFDVFNAGTNTLTATIHGYLKKLNTTSSLLTAGYTTLDVWGYIDLKTNLITLNGETFLAGNVKLIEVDALTIEDLQVLNGNFDYTGGGNLIVTNLVAANGGATMGISGTVNIANMNLTNGSLDLDATGLISATTLTVTTGSVDITSSTSSIFIHDLDVLNGNVDLTAKTSITVEEMDQSNSQLPGHANFTAQTTFALAKDATLTDTDFTIASGTSTQIDLLSLTHGNLDITSVGSTLVDNSTILDGSIDVDTTGILAAATFNDLTLTNGNLDIVSTGLTLVDLSVITNGNVIVDAGTSITFNTLTLKDGVDAPDNGNLTLKSGTFTLLDVADITDGNTNIDSGTYTRINDIGIIRGYLDIDAGLYPASSAAATVLITLADIDTGYLDITAGGDVTVTTLDQNDGNITVKSAEDVLFTLLTLVNGNVDITSAASTRFITSTVTNGNILVDAGTSITFNTLTLVDGVTAPDNGNLTLDSGTFTYLGTADITDGNTNIDSGTSTLIDDIAIIRGYLDIDAGLYPAHNAASTVTITLGDINTGYLDITSGGDVTVSSLDQNDGNITVKSAEDVLFTSLTLLNGNLDVISTISSRFVTSTVTNGNILVDAGTSITFNTLTLVDGTGINNGDLTLKSGTFTFLDVADITDGNTNIDSGTYTQINDIGIIRGYLDIDAGLYPAHNAASSVTITLADIDTGYLDITAGGDVTVSTLDQNDGNITVKSAEDVLFTSLTLLNGNTDITSTASTRFVTSTITNGNVLVDAGTSITFNTLTLVDGTGINNGDLTLKSGTFTLLDIADISDGNTNIDSGTYTQINDIGIIRGYIDIDAGLYPAHNTASSVTITLADIDTGYLDITAGGDVTVSTLDQNDGNITVKSAEDVLFTSLTLLNGNLDVASTASSRFVTSTVTNGNILVDAGTSITFNTLTLVDGTGINNGDLTLKSGTFTLLDIADITDGNTNIDSGTYTQINDIGIIRGYLDIDAGLYPAHNVASSVTITLADIDTGYLDITAGGDVTVSTLDQNDGNITVKSAEDVLFSSLTLLNGNLDVTSTASSHFVTSTVTNGNILVDAGTSITFDTLTLVDGVTAPNNGDLTLDSGTFTHIGTADVTDGNINIDSGTYTLIDDLDLIRGYLDIDAGLYPASNAAADVTITLATIDTGYLNITAGGDTTLTDVTVIGGDVDIKSGIDVGIDLLKVQTPGKYVDVLAGRKITIDDLWLDGSTGFVNLEATTGYIAKQLGRIIADEIVAKAATGISANTDINFVTATNTATGDISFHELNSLTLIKASTVSGEFEIEAGGRIDVSASTILPTPHVIANNMRLITNNGIALETGFLNAYVDTIEATADVNGGIFIHNLKDVNLTHVLANDGKIIIDANGNMTATDVRINVDTEVNDLILQTFNSGNMLVNFIGVGMNTGTPGVLAPSLADILLLSNGDINAVDPAFALEDVNIMAETIILDAQTGLGNTESPRITGRVLQASTAVGDMSISNYSTNDFLLANYTTGNGNLRFSQYGGGDLTVTNIASLNGNITVTVGNSGTLFLYDSTSLGETPTTGNTTLIGDEMEFLGGDSSVFGSNTIKISPFTPGMFVHIQAQIAGTPSQDPRSLELGDRELHAISRTFDSILVGSLENLNFTFMDYPETQSELEEMLEDEADTFFAQPSGYVSLSDLLDASDTPIPKTSVELEEENDQFFSHVLSSFDDSAFEDEIPDEAPAGDVPPQTAPTEADIHYEIRSATPIVATFHKAPAWTSAAIALMPLAASSHMASRTKKTVKKILTKISLFSFF